jgi:UDP-N-acetylmuramate dehydrogenase
VYILGRGSNIVASDAGLKAAVIRLDAAAFKKISSDGVSVHAGAGGSLAALVRYCAVRGLSGLEFLVGIPGTIGGALVMNAGITANGRSFSIGDFVESVTVMDYNSTVTVLGRKSLKFGYRSSNLISKCVLAVRFRLQKKDKASIRQAMAAYAARRRKTQDRQYPNAGCIFKNPRAASAGQLIDGCGLKGRRRGGSQVSRTHANFIINVQHAKACDVLRLMRVVQKEVKSKYRILLEPEIKIWQ